MVLSFWALALAAFMSSLWFILQSSSVLSPTSFVSSLIPSFRLYLYLSLSDLLMTSSPLSLLSSYPPPSSELLVSDLLLVSSALLPSLTPFFKFPHFFFLLSSFHKKISHIFKKGNMWPPQNQPFFFFFPLSFNMQHIKNLPLNWLWKMKNDFFFFLLHVSISCSPNQHLSFTFRTTSLFFFHSNFQL